MYFDKLCKKLLEGTKTAPAPTRTEPATRPSPSPRPPNPALPSRNPGKKPGPAVRPKAKRVEAFLKRRGL